MSNKIYLRIGSWYRATDKALLPDIDMSAIIQDVNAEYPVIKDDSGGGGSGGTLQDAIDAGAVLDKDNIIDANGHVLTFYSEDAGDNNDAQLLIGPLGITIAKTVDGVFTGEKEIATESAISQDIVIPGVGTITVTNGIITAFTPE